MSVSLHDFNDSPTNACSWFFARFRKSNFYDIPIGGIGRFRFCDEDVVRTISGERVFGGHEAKAGRVLTKATSDFFLRCIGFGREILSGLRLALASNDEMLRAVGKTPIFDQPLDRSFYLTLLIKKFEFFCDRFGFQRLIIIA